jgi:hypothetical protein
MAFRIARMNAASSEARDCRPRLAGYGPLLLQAVAVCLLLAGLVVFVLGVSGRFLPHDEDFLGMTARDLCAVHGCRVVHFMVHDRVSFGGAILAVGLLYLWLIAVPLRQGEPWAWWTLLLSGAVGFASFFAYLGYGYLDTWHGLATLGLLPGFVVGMARAPAKWRRSGGVGRLFQPAVAWPWHRAAGFGRLCFLAVAAGLACGGLTIMMVGMTCVFVPQDLAYLGLSVEELQALNERLVPLIAHDRAGFGGAVCSCGIAQFVTVWSGKPSRSLWVVLALVGMAGFGAALGVHAAVGYDDPIHLAPAALGALVYASGMALTFRPMMVDCPSASV